jgi:hypothetical protein
MTNALPVVIETLGGATTVGAGPTQLAELLETLDIELFHAGVPVAFRAPVGHDSVVDALGKVELFAPEELRVLYGWHDGHVFGQRATVPRFPYIPLQDCVAKYRMQMAVLDELATESMTDSTEDFDWGAPRGWMRLWGDNYAIAVECASSGDEPPRLRSTTEDFWWASRLRQVVSLCTVVTWLIDGIRLGGHVWDPDQGIWLLDWGQVPTLQRKYGFV